MTFKIITDSTADLNEEWAKEHAVTIMGLTIELDGKSYDTTGDNRIKVETLLEQMKNGAQPKTSQVNVGQFEEVFRQAAKDEQEVLYIAFSSVLSGTYQSAVMARDLVLADYPKATIEIIDTLAAAGGEGYLSMLAVEARDKGKSLLETKAMIEDILPRLRTYFLVDDLHHLVRGGRLSKTTAVVGSLANIKPLLWIDTQGRLVALAKVRGRKKGMKKMVECATEELGHSTAVVAYANDREAAESLKASLLENETITEVIILPLGPVISAHVGPNTLAIFTIAPLVKSSATSSLITRAPEVKLFGLAQTKYLRFYTCEVV